MKKGILLITLGLTLLGCLKDSRVGTFSLQVTEQNIEIISNNSQTKASLSDEELDSFLITILETEIPSDLYGNVKGKTYVLSVGDYTASAESCTSETAESTNNHFGCLRYTGSKNFTVSTETPATVNIGCTVANSKVSVLLHPDFLSVFDKSQTTVTLSKDANGTDRPLEFNHFTILEDSGNSAVAMTDANATASRYAFYPAESNLYLHITTRKIGATETATYHISTPIVTEVATWHKISVNANINSTTGGIIISIEGGGSEPVNNGFSIDGYQNGSVTED